MLRRCLAIAFLGAGVSALCSSDAAAAPKVPEPKPAEKSAAPGALTAVKLPKKAVTGPGHNAKSPDAVAVAKAAPVAELKGDTKAASKPDAKDDARAPSKTEAPASKMADTKAAPKPALAAAAAAPVRAVVPAPLAKSVVTPPAPPAPIALPAPTVPTPPPAAAPLPWPTAPKIGLAVERFQLTNGLRVVLVPDASVPTIAVAVTYDVGSRDEAPGRTGFAHLFEHMMFQGSAHVPRGAFDRYLSARGGSNNGTTNEDRTEYFEQLPSHELPLALWLEADRLEALQVTPENFENQRAVVKEEYRMSVANRPYALSSIALQEKVYAAYPAYAHDAIGSMEDLDAAAFPWVEEFHRRHYGPNRAILAIAGAMDVREAKSLVEKYFAAIPASAEAAPIHAKRAAAPTASRTVRKDPLAKLTRIDDGWLMPSCDDDDRYALEVAAAVLGDGESSRLERILVRERGVAVEVEASVDDRRGPSMFSVGAMLASGVSLARAEGALSRELERLGTDGPTDAEVRKALARLEAQLLHSIQSNLNRALALSAQELRTGDASTYERDLERYFRVRPADVARVVKQWLSPKNRVRIITEPAPASASVAKQESR
jgi:predicted Zn-dependent peptidase